MCKHNFKISTIDREESDHTQKKLGTMTRSKYICFANYGTTAGKKMLLPKIELQTRKLIVMLRIWDCRIVFLEAILIQFPCNAVTAFA
jgi:hypothetical protein